VAAVIVSCLVAGALMSARFRGLTAPICFAVACAAGVALALRSTGLTWQVDLDEAGALFTPVLGLPIHVPMNALSLQVWPDRLVSAGDGVDLELSPTGHHALVAWLDPKHFVPYGTPPGMVRFVPRSAVYTLTAEKSPVLFASNLSWSQRRAKPITAVPWLVPDALRSRAPGGIAGKNSESPQADLQALGKELEGSPGDPTAVRSGDQVPIWPVCCGHLVQHQMANPVRHEILLCLDEPLLGALESALVDPILARQETPAERQLAKTLERRFIRELERLRGGIRPSGIDVFRCQQCFRVYVVCAL
jgi:hypothetical protein